MTPFHATSFRWLWASTLFHATAQGMERTATAWLALLAGGDALAVGLGFAARMLPSLLFGLVTGTLADRADRTRQVLAVAAAGVPLLAGFGWWSARGDLQVWQVVLISFAAGCLQVFDVPARQALVLDTVRPELAPNAVALNALASRLFSAVGSFAAGLLIPLAGVAACYFGVAGAFALGAVCAAFVRVPRVSRLAGAAAVSFRASFGSAARMVVQNPAVRTLTLASVACEIFAFSFMTAVPGFARDVLDAGPSGLGLLNAATSLGGTAGVMGLSLLPARVRREPILGAVFVVYGASLLALGAARDLALAAAILAVTGACAASFDVLQQTLIQLAVPASQRGRAVGIWVLGIGSAPIGHVEMGLLAASAGAPAALLVNGALVLASAAILLARAPRYRWGAPPAPSPSAPGD